MPSERIQRRIDAFLDQAEEASNRDEWGTVASKARAVLAIDESHEDALAFLKMAEANGVTLASDTPVARPVAETPTPTTVSAPPDSFAGGRYIVQRLLGEGGKKRVYLAHDELLDRDVAFALIRSEGLDEVGRERVRCRLHRPRRDCGRAGDREGCRARSRVRARAGRRAPRSAAPATSG